MQVPLHLLVHLRQSSATILLRHWKQQQLIQIWGRDFQPWCLQTKIWWLYSANENLAWIPTSNNLLWRSLNPVLVLVPAYLICRMPLSPSYRHSQSLLQEYMERSRMERSCFHNLAWTSVSCFTTTLLLSGCHWCEPVLEVWLIYWRWNKILYPWLCQCMRVSSCQ